MTYTIQKKLIELSNGVPLFEYHLLNEYGSIVATICSEDLALKIKECLNNESG